MYIFNLFKFRLMRFIIQSLTQCPILNVMLISMVQIFDTLLEPPENEKEKENQQLMYILFQIY